MAQLVCRFTFAGINRCNESEDTHMSNNIQKGQIVTGKVTKVVKDGVLVEVEPKVNGYLHVSQLSGKSREERDAALPKLTVGTEVTVEVTDIAEKDGRTRISLSQWRAEKVLREQRFHARQAARQQVLQSLTPGSSVTGVIKRLENYGVLVTVANEGEVTIDALLHVSELNGKDRRARDRRLSTLAVGEKVDVEVIEVKEEKGQTRIRLSERRGALRQALASVKPGVRTSGTYVRNDETGLVIELTGGVEGILPHDALGSTKVESITRKPGQTVKVIVESIDETAGVIWLTRKGL
jgi:small subunit ribosomal protein S1